MRPRPPRVGGGGQDRVGPTASLSPVSPRYYGPLSPAYTRLGAPHNASCLRVHLVLLMISVALVCHTPIFYTLPVRPRYLIHKKHLQHQLRSYFPSLSRIRLLPFGLSSIFNHLPACYTSFQHIPPEHSSH